MLCFRRVRLIVMVFAVLLAACQPAATPAELDNFIATEAPAETEAPAATEPPPFIAVEVASPVPTKAPTSLPVATAAPPDESLPSSSQNCPVFQITSPEWEDQLKQSPVPVLMYFWYDEDNESKAIAPLIQEIANEYAGRIRVGQVEMDNFPVIGGYYGIGQFPAVLFMDGTNEIGRVERVTSKSEITEMMEQQFANYPILTENASTACIVDALIEITGYDWTGEFITTSEPFLVYFWSESDPASSLFLPKIRVIASEYAGRIKVAASNMDDDPVVGYTYGFGEQLPAFLLLQQGNEVARREGTMSKEEITQWLDQYLASNP